MEIAQWRSCRGWRPNGVGIEKGAKLKRSLGSSRTMG